MLRDVKYSADAHGGLELVQFESAPEVVTKGPEAPQVVYDQEAPEVLPRYVPPAEHEEKETLILSPGADSRTLSSRDGNGDSAVPVTPIGEAEKEPERLFCGMKRRTCFVVTGVAVFLLIATIVGVVLGIVLSQKARHKIGAQTGDNYNIAFPGAGIAMLEDPAVTGQLLVYYQNGVGVYEDVQYPNSTWSATYPFTENQASASHGQDINGGSIAAVAYTLAGVYTRRVFFLGSNGGIYTAASTTFAHEVAQNWSIPVAIGGPTATSNATGLAACVGNATAAEDGLVGLRVYYGTPDARMQELRYDFSKDGRGGIGNGTSSGAAKGWFLGDAWNAVDASAGFACVVSPTGQTLDVAYQSTSSAVQLLSKDLEAAQDSWTLWSIYNITASSISDIAICYDDAQTEYIFYQTRTGIITRGIISSNPDGSHNTTAGSSSASSASSAGDDNPATTTATYSLNFATVNSLQLGASGTKLAAAWSNGASWYLYQNSSDQPYCTQIQFSGVTRNGANLLSGWSDPVPDNYG